MQPSATSVPPATGELTDGLKAALLTLLADEDPAVHEAARGRIEAAGTAAMSWLAAQAGTSDLALRRRVTRIRLHLGRQEMDNEFLAYCLQHGDDGDLEAGVWRLARTEYPDLPVAACRARLDAMAEVIAGQLGGQGRSLGCLAVINDHLFQTLGFRGDEQHFYDPENSYLNRVLDRRRGNPISLCTLYWLVAKRLQLPVVGIGLPRHFLCRYQSPTETVYIDAFHRGKLLTRADCIRYLQQIGQGFQEAYLAPATPGRTLLRMCANLHQIHHERGDREAAARLQRYIVALARH